MPLFHRRDGVLIILGATIVYLFSSLLQPGPPIDADSNQLDLLPPLPAGNGPTLSIDPLALDVGYADALPETTVIAHAPGYTLFRNLYMANCTFFAISPNTGDFPQRRMITSTGLIALNEPENIRLREPTDQEFQIISPKRERHRVWSIEGNSVSCPSKQELSTHNSLSNSLW
jgi:hypothetical protein